ncbi:MAG: hypothetical protein PF630_12800 [Gammaproteobacteria bacterium]|jgi:hypothetical protein|nr:hypothetical protein [Gammaproteobacteria bacterium]
MKQPKPIQQAVNPDLRGSWLALLRTTKRVRELAIQTGTTLVISHQDVIEHIWPQPEAVMTQVHDKPATYGDKP